VGKRLTPVGRAELAKLVDACHLVPLQDRSIWHNAVLELWGHILELENNAGSPG
jgi:hypothetical protein